MKRLQLITLLGTSAVLGLQAVAARRALMVATAPEQRAFDESERLQLAQLFRHSAWVLAGTMLILLTLTILGVGAGMAWAAWVSAGAGALGSATTALVSCLNRHANGFEDSHGLQTPESETRKERFNRGMYYWFLARPLLGAVTAVVLFWGSRGGILGPQLNVPEQVAFYGFLTGVLAKTVLDLLRGLLNNIFK